MAPVVRFLILSDTHNISFPDPTSLPAVDVVLHCGDLTMAGGLSNYRSAMSSLEQVDAELKLVVAGNHDLELDSSWWLANLDEDDDPDEPHKAFEVMRSAWDRGLHYLEEGVHRFTLKSGATFSVYASAYTPEFNGYTFAYGSDEDRFTGGGEAKSPIPADVDIVMTHGPPKIPSSFQLPGSADYTLDTNGKEEHLGCSHLWQAVQRTKPLLHCFGHIHEGYGAQGVSWSEEGRGVIHDTAYETCPHHRRLQLQTRARNETLLVNASVRRHGQEENNVSWVVELELGG
ncbi:hypothetical protein PG993_009255 [Apiospora rasikravindrae]|uniref:Calcineurin-like phosphoesterase domain-containing protein n=1 Tax=Apiospora rasikravindrae TaxID=990691 RepID=A0ABR1SIW0_9PEZI